MTSVYAVPVEAPAGTAECPVHGQTVAYEPGCLLGRCDGCSMEVAQGLVWLKKHPTRRKTR